MAPPLPGGGLVVSGGRILAMGRAADLSRAWPGAAPVDLDGCALLPPLVNAHTHLELTGLGPPPPAGDFAEWLLGVIERKRSARSGDFVDGLERGAGICLAKGQGVVADVLSAAGGNGYSPAGPEVAVFPEVIAPGPAAVEGALAEALSGVLPAPARLAGISPHAPYTACAEAYGAARREAEARGLLLMAHAAESAEEVEFCVRGTGPVPERLYRELGLEPPTAPGLHPVDWLDRLGLVGPRTLLVHLAHLAPEHPELIARRRGKAVLCPRSNRRLSGRAAPGLELLRAGVVLGLGTDSVLSAGDLDLWQDVIAAVEDYGWTPATALEVATLGGTRLLGLGADRGGFAAGGRADILAISLAAGRELWDRLLADPEPAALWLGGQLRWARPGFPIVRSGPPAG